MHCGATAGLLRQRHDVPGTPALFQNGGGGASLVIRSLAALRCARCRGPVYTDDFELRYVYPKPDPEALRPRRGRPPKWLVELRRAEEAESQPA
jgi:hypothetical protein